jgi:hypothetical protein
VLRKNFVAILTVFALLILIYCLLLCGFLVHYLFKVAKHSDLLNIYLFRWVGYYKAASVNVPPITTFVLYKVPNKLFKTYLQLSQQIPSDIVNKHYCLFQKTAICRAEYSACFSYLRHGDILELKRYFRVI